MRVGFLLPDLGMGGAQRHTLDLARRLAIRGHQCRLAVFNPRVSDDLVREFDDLDITFLHAGRMSAPSHWLRTARALGRPDVVFCVNQTPAILGAGIRLAARGRYRLFTIFHTTLLLESDERRLPAFQAAVRMGDGLIFVSRNQLAYWTGKRLKAPRLMAIVNGIDLARYALPAAALRRDMRSELGLAADAFVIALLATFRPEKNHLQLLDAVAALRADGVPAIALMIGDGATRAAVESRAKEIGVHAFCRFPGEQPDVRAYVAASEVGVLCSTSVETLSLAALEMGAMGLPLVLSDIGGATEIVADGINGFVFPSGDTGALVERLKAVHAERPRFAAAARSKIAVGFDIDRMVDEYDALIRNGAAPDR